MDWRTTGWWDMPGPSRFVGKVADLAIGSETGVLGLALPDPRPSGLLDAIATRIEGNPGILVTRVDARQGLRGRSATTLLAASAGIVARVRTVEDFVRSPGLTGRLFIVDGIEGDDWESWAIFLTLLRAERKRAGSLLAPAVLIALPTIVPGTEYRSVVDRVVRWGGAVARMDTELYAERECGWPDDGLVARTAVSVIVELAGWDPSMVRTLAGWSAEDLVDPRDQILSAPDILAGRTPAWANGLVDRWDGVSFAHTLCFRHEEKERLGERVWRAHVRTVFPFLDQVRRAFAAKFDRQIQTKLPLTKRFNTREVVYTRPQDLELHDINELLRGDLSRKEAQLLAACKFLRRQMAHGEPGDAGRIIAASELWEETGSSFPDDVHAWEWPRCGQKLILLVGPSGAGKSHWAKRNYDPDEIVSSDLIREQLFGGLIMTGDQQAVFDRLRSEVTGRLSAGKSVVIDATNIRQQDRLSNARLMPLDLSVEYIVIDRPMQEKVETAGWRLDRNGLLADHDQVFNGQLADILSGDGLSNVTVRDMRSHTRVSKKGIGE